MSEKYIDLASRISNESGAYHLRDTIIEGVLEWLDEHPDQVPGRTITQGEYEDALEGKSWDYGVGYFEAISRFDITVVPDPEPTNAEKLIPVLRKVQSLGWMDGLGSEMDFARLARILDLEGVKAPGGNDD